MYLEQSLQYPFRCLLDLYLSNSTLCCPGSVLTLSYSHYMAFLCVEFHFPLLIPFMYLIYVILKPLINFFFLYPSQGFDIICKHTHIAGHFLRHIINVDKKTLLVPAPSPVALHSSLFSTLSFRPSPPILFLCPSNNPSSSSLYFPHSSSMSQHP